MSITPTAARVIAIDKAINAIDNLDVMCVHFYGADADAIDAIKATLAKQYTAALWEDYEADSKAC